MDDNKALVADRQVDHNNKALGADRQVDHNNKALGADRQVDDNKALGADRQVDHNKALGADRQAVYHHKANMYNTCTGLFMKASLERQHARKKEKRQIASSK